MKTIKKIMMLVLSLMAFVAEAQELEVVSFKQSFTDIIAKSDQRKDYNGDACALVKVQMVDDIDRVEGNVIGSVVKRGNEKWIYLTNGTRSFSIYPKNHLSVRINCNDYKIPELKGKSVYVLRLKGDEKTTVILKDTVVVEKEREVVREVVKEGKTSVRFYLQPAVQAGTMMGFGGNIGVYIANFNIEAFVTSTMQKEKVSLISNNSSLDVDLSGLMIGGKVGYGISLTPNIRLTPQVGLGSLSIKGDDLSTSVMCATVGARFEYLFTPNFGISLTPEGQLAIGKQDIFEQLTNASSKIKGWGTGGNVRLGIFVMF